MGPTAELTGINVLTKVPMVTQDVAAPLGGSLFLLTPSLHASAMLLSSPNVATCEISDTKTTVCSVQGSWKAQRCPLPWDFGRSWHPPLTCLGTSPARPQWRGCVEMHWGRTLLSTRIFPIHPTHGPSHLVPPHPRTQKADLFFPRAEFPLSICLHHILPNLASGCAFCFPRISEIK